MKISPKPSSSCGTGEDAPMRVRHPRVAEYGIRKGAIGQLAHFGQIGTLCRAERHTLSLQQLTERAHLWLVCWK